MTLKSSNLLISLALVALILVNCSSAHTSQEVGAERAEKVDDSVLARALRDVETDAGGSEEKATPDAVVVAKPVAQNLSDSEVHSENNHSWTVFFILCILAFSILLIHVLIQFNFHYLPESVAVVFLGAIIGLIFKLLSQWNVSDWSVSIGLVVHVDENKTWLKQTLFQREESFTPTIFFLVLLPPIIFESGYNLHKVLS